MFRPIAAVIFVVTFAGPVRADEKIKVPSGQTITYVDTIQDSHGPGGLTYRFRFLAPAIARAGGTVSADDAEADMVALCEIFALARLPNPGPEVQEIVISLSDQPVEFGVPAPEVTQFFEAFRPDGAACIWEGF